MERGSVGQSPPKGGSGRQGSEAHPACLNIEIDERSGTVRVYDPRVFHAGRRAFCRRLLQNASRQPGFERAEIDLAAAACRIEFDPGSVTSQSMADAFCAAVQEATAGPASTEGPAWWRAARWSALTAYRLADDVSVWETLEARSDRIRLRHRGISGDRGRLARLTGTLAGLRGVETCRVSRWFHTITLELGPDGPVADRLVDRVERVRADVLAVRHGSSERATSQVVGALSRATSGLERFKYLVLAGGAFAMTLVALVVPGIPTVPCLLATSYYLARSSPRLDERLRRTAFLGPILDEWERSHGLSWSSKGKLIGLTVTIVVLTVALTPLSPLALVLILLASSLSVYEIVRLPALASEPRPATRLEGPSRPALTTP
jgi:uncharacterized membrane protein YbaN (DUF454 family)